MPETSKYQQDSFSQHIIANSTEYAVILTGSLALVGSQTRFEPLLLTSLASLLIPVFIALVSYGSLKFFGRRNIRKRQ